MSLRLKRLSSSIEVSIERKKIKNVRLRVLPSGMVKMSVPFGVANPWIDDYLQKKLPWIEKSLAYFKDRVNLGIGAGIKSGGAVYILGEQMTIMVSPSKIYKIERKEDVIHIQSPVSTSQPALQRQFERWLHKESKAYFIKVMDRLYPIIAEHSIRKPKLHVRKMKTLWGSCSRTHHKINLNCYLLKAPPPCVDYVVLHELAHFLYPQHNRDFYAFLTLHMPNWKERKKTLNQASLSLLDIRISDGVIPPIPLC